MKYFKLNICLVSLLFTLNSIKANTSNSIKLKSGVQDTLVGTLNIFITDDFENNISEKKIQLVCDDDKIYQLPPSSNIKLFKSGDNIRIIGTNLKSIEKSNRLKSSIFNESKIELIERKKYVTEDTYGEQKYAIILFNFRNDKRKPFTKALVEEQFFGPANSADANIREMSREKAWLKGDVFDNGGEWYTIDMDTPRPFEEANVLLMLELARTAADKDIDYRDYKSIVYILPNLRAVPWGGVGTTTPILMETEDGNIMKHFVAINGILNEFIVTHEITHNFGVGHDSKRFYPEGIYFGEPLGFDPYGNIFSFMGEGYGHISLAFSKYIWPGEFNVTEINTPGSYSIKLAPIADTTESKKGNIHGVTIPVDPTSNWIIEYRNEIGMDADNNWMNILGSGLVVYLQEYEPNSNIQTYIPYQDDLLSPNIVKENEEFLDPIAGLRVMAMDTTPDGLINVEIELQPGKENIRINKRDTDWPKKVSQNHSAFLNYTLQNNAYIDITDTFEVTLYQKYENEQWKTVPGQNRIISDFSGRDTLSGSFEWMPALTGIYHLRIVADAQNRINELSKFDNYTPKGQTGHAIEVIADCNSIEINENVAICSGDSYFSWSVPGQYQRTLMSSAGCDSTITTHLTINELPIVEFFIGGDTLTSLDTFPTYQWYDENGTIEGATSNHHIIDKNGTYYLEVTDTNGCSSLSNEVDLIKTNINEIDQKKLKITVLPNPNNGMFRIGFKNGSVGKYRLQILNDLGQIHLSKKIYINLYDHEETIQLSHLPKGNYIVQVSNDISYYSQKIILQ